MLLPIGNGSSRRGKLRTFVIADIAVVLRHPKARPAYCFPQDLPVFIAEQTQGTKPKLRRNPNHLALELRRALDEGRANSKADLARHLGVSRAHVTQVLRLLCIAPEAKEANRGSWRPIGREDRGRTYASGSCQTSSRRAAARDRPVAQ